MVFSWNYFMNILKNGLVLIFFSTIIFFGSGCDETVPHRTVSTKKIDLKKYSHYELQCEISPPDNVLSLGSSDIGEYYGAAQGGLIGYFVAVSVLNLLNDNEKDNQEANRDFQEESLINAITSNFNYDPCKKISSEISNSLGLSNESPDDNPINIYVKYKYYLSNDGKTLHGITKLKITDGLDNDLSSNYIYKTEYLVETSDDNDGANVTDAIDYWIKDNGEKIVSSISSLIRETNNLIKYDMNHIRLSSDNKTSIKKKSCYESRSTQLSGSKFINRFKNGKRIEL